MDGPAGGGWREVDGAGGADSRGEPGQGIPEHCGEVEIGEMQALFAAVGIELARDVDAPLGGLFDLVEVFGELRGRGLRVSCKRGVGQDNLDEIVEVVSHTSGEFLRDFDALGAAERLLHGQGPGDIAGDHDEALSFVVVVEQGNDGDFLGEGRAVLAFVLETSAPAASALQ
ncbi:MAG: hypothetical protein BWX86_02470 [Verrucomicrobia bacterium ADurb.Bin122]|nr:MAG: hypothetical protein BWX86_02470 [Verrucomicrobia bacterium ADurb.Bin122]